jgi:hypothetical protein
MWAMAAVTFFWAFSRHLNVYLLWMATIVAALATLSRARRRHFVVLVCVLGAVALTGTIVSSSNTTVQHANITAIIIRRIAPDADLRLWWRREGMPPLPPGVPPSPLPNAKNPSDQAIFDQADLLYEDKRFPSWLGDHANSAYLRFLATHPRYILTTPFTDRAVIDGFLRGAIYTHTMQVVPNFVEDVVWPTTRWGALLVVLALTIVCFVVFASSRRLHGDRVLSSRSTAPLRYAGAVLVISGVAAFLTTHVAGVEFGRVLLVPAVAARSAVVIVIAAVVDEALSRRRESTS